MRKVFLNLIATVFICDTLGGQESDNRPLSQPAAPAIEAAQTFAQALKQADAIMGAYEISDRPLPTVLPSGEILENIPGYSAATIRYSLCQLNLVQPIAGTSNSVAFISQLFCHIEGQPFKPFPAIPGSRWILALQKSAGRVNDGGVVLAENVPNIIRQNLYQSLDNTSRAVCLRWPKAKGIPQPKYLVNVDEAAVEDLKQLRDFYNAQKSRTIWLETDINLVRESLKSDFGKAVLHKLLRDQSQPVKSE
jgi:hypothetical protein